MIGCGVQLSGEADRLVFEFEKQSPGGKRSTALVNCEITASGVWFARVSCAQ